MENGKNGFLVSRSITIAICTFKRPKGLGRLLDAIWIQENIQSHEIQVIVVDNDANASARSVVLQAKPPSSGWLIQYYVEDRPGVSHARNRCLIESKTDLIAFIDDDEVPQPKWLASLLHTQSVTGADVVCGPVIPRYESEPPEWVIRNKVFERNRFVSNTRINWKDSRSGNVLLHRGVVDLAGGGFDTRFATSGGEDSLFFYQAERSGATIVWSDEAWVYEDIPVSRVNVKWVLRRSYKGGQNWVRICAQSNSLVWLPMAIKGLLVITLNTPLVVPTLFISKPAAIRFATRAVGGLGKITAWWASKKADRTIKSEHYVG